MQIRYSSHRIVIPKVEFYITNVCNLTCARCNRFNNHDFKGFQRWNDYAEHYRRWSELIDIEKIVILGGEPLLNPTLIDWVNGINRLWRKNVQILSNGTRINHVPGLYNLLRQRNWLGISWHNEDTFEDLDSELRSFLKSPITVIQGQHKNIFGADWVYKDTNGVTIPVWRQDRFGAAAVHLDSNGNFTLHQNDAQQAHAVCGFAKYQCYHFIRGALYKCGPVALFPEFDKQFDLALSPEDRMLTNSYRPLTLEDFDDRAIDFLSHIDDPIPQCKFCPVNSDVQVIRALRKGTKISTLI